MGMTREEIIKHLNRSLNSAKHLGFNYVDTVSVEMLEAVIKLLKQEPCETKIDESYHKGFALGLKTAEQRYNNAIAEIREQADRLKDSLYGDGLRHALEIFNKYRMGGSMVQINMEMPKRCAECKFCIKQETNDYGTHGKCLLQDKSVDCLVWSRDKNCPLIESEE